MPSKYTKETLPVPRNSKASHRFSIRPPPQMCTCADCAGRVYQSRPDFKPNCKTSKTMRAGGDQVRGRAHAGGAVLQVNIAFSLSSCLPHLRPLSPCVHLGSGSAVTCWHARALDQVQASGDELRSAGPSGTSRRISFWTLGGKNGRPCAVSR